MNIQNIYIVIAAYNEGPKIAEVIKSLRKIGLHDVIVVDDGSRDSTSLDALNAGATVLVHPINLGQGAALQTGIDYALKCSANYIVTFDADGQHDPQDILPAIETLNNTKVDIVLGSRFKGKTVNMGNMKRIFLVLATIYTRYSTGLGVTDTHNGFRIFTICAAKAIRITQNRMAHASEILNQISAKKLKYVEHPVTITYTEYSIAKGQRISNSVNIMKDLFLGGLHK